MYKGQTIEAMPTPTPPIQRKKISDAVDHASPQPREQASRKADATTSAFLAEAVAGRAGQQASQHGADHGRTDEPTFHHRREAESLDDQILGAGDDEQVVAEQQAAQRRGERAEQQVGDTASGK